MNLFGNYTALITPFVNQRQIDYDTLEKLITFQVKEESDGIVLFGSTGEGHLLSEREKIKVLQLARKVVPADFTLIVSILGYTTSQCKREINKFANLGADAFLISIPPYIKPTQTGILNHFTELANFTKKPIILYNIPSRTGQMIEFDTLQKLSKHPQIIAVKEASTCFSDIVRESTLLSDNFKILAGNDNFILPMLSIGASGVVSVAGNFIPKTMHTICEMFSFDPALCKRLYHNIERTINAMSVETNPIPVKYYSSLMFGFNPIYRKPLCQPAPRHKNYLKQIFNDNIAFYHNDICNQ